MLVGGSAIAENRQAHVDCAGRVGVCYACLYVFYDIGQLWTTEYRLDT